MHPSLIRKPVDRLILRVLILVLVQTVVTAWIFRANWSDGFRHVLGDVYDNTIELAILEHWYNVFRGLSHWSVTHYFYPYPDTLGYNDGYWFYGVLYSIWRTCGADPFLSSTLVNLEMKAACFLFFFLFSRNVLRLGFWYALTGAAIFELSNNLAIHTSHAQLLTVAFVPLCATLLYFACTAFFAGQAGRLFLFGAAFSLVYGLWALTSYYMLWFFSFFVSIVLVVLAVANRKWLARQLIDTDRKTMLALTASVVVLLVALLPFLLVYLPKARETGMHGYSAALQYALSLYDIANIGRDNYLYGSIVPPLHAAIGFPMEFSEHQMGMPPVLLVTFLLGCVMLWRRRSGGMANVMWAVMLSTILLWGLALATNEYSAWYLVFHAFPGAKAIRVVSRCLIFMTVPVLCVSLYAMSAWSARQSHWVHAAVLFYCVVLVTEELNRVSHTAIDREAAVQTLESIPAAPIGCRAFFVLDAAPLASGQGQVDRIYRHNVAAMLISEYINLPTINGYSSFNPPDWVFADPQVSDYVNRVRTYQRKHQITGLCALDLETMKWSSHPL